MKPRLNKATILRGSYKLMCTYKDIQDKHKDTLLRGLTWYYEAHLFASLLSQRYNIGITKVAHVISALSPAVSWEKNKQDAQNLIKEYYHLFKG